MKAALAPWVGLLDRPDAEVWPYNMTDCEQTFIAAQALDGDVTHFGVRPTAERMLAIALPAHRMSERGMLVDADQRAALRKRVIAELSIRAEGVKQIFDEQLGGALQAAVAIGGVLRRLLNPRRKARMKSTEFNLRSRANLTLLFSALGMKWSEVTPKGGTQLDLDVVMKLRRAYPEHDELLLRLWEYKKLEKVRSDWLADAKGISLLCDDQRLRASVRVTGTQSGRFSEARRDWCARCLKDSHGRNRQNLPKADDDFMNEHAPIRSMVVPGPGRAFVCVDYASLEAWIAARLSGDPVFLNRLESGSIHVENARDLFGLPATLSAAEIKGMIQYRMAKIFLFGGVLYLGGPETIRSSYEEHGIVVPLADVKLQQARWKMHHQVFTQWQYRVVQQAAATRPHRAVTALGRQRLFTGPPREWARDCLAHLISGTGADYVNEAFIELDRTLPAWPAAGILLHNHDELVVECDREVIDQVSRQMLEAFERDRGLGVFKAECKVGLESFHELQEWRRA